MLIQKLDNFLLPFYPTSKFSRYYYIRKDFFSFKLKPTAKAIIKLLSHFQSLLFLSFYLIPAILIYLFGYRIFLVDLHQIGIASFLDWHIKKKLLSNINTKKIIVFRAKHYPLANDFLLDKYNNYVTFLSGFFIRAICLPFTYFPFLVENFFEYDISFNKTSEAKKIFNDFNKKYKEKTLIKFSLEEKSSYEKIINDKLKIHPYRYVTLHIRSSYFNNEKHESSRNSNIETYFSAIKFLVDAGLKVVIVGDNNFQYVKYLEEYFKNNFVNYSNSRFRTKELDIFILSECFFHIGTNSGLSYFSSLQGRPTLYVNMYYADASLGFLEHDLTIFKKYMKNGELLSLKDYFSSPYRRLYYRQEMQSLGLVLVDNSEDEILEATKEIYRNLNCGEIKVSKIQRKVKNMIASDSFSYHSVSNFSNYFLLNYKK